MVLVAGLMLLAASAIDAYIGKEVNSLYLGIGTVFVIFSTALLIFKKK